MRVVYYIREISLRGGVKVLAQHVRLLRERGIEAELLARRNAVSGFYVPEPLIIEGENAPRLNADVCVATRPGDVPFLLKAFHGRKTTLCHLFQGDEIGDFQFRMRHLWNANGAVVSPLDRLVQTIKLYRRIKRFDKIYRLPTIKMAVSRHLCRLIEARYQQECVEMTNGVDLSVFKPAPNPRSVGGPWRLVSVGPLSTAFKGIEFVLAAIAKLKGTGYPVHFTRFPVGSVTDFERKAALVDASVYSVSEREVAQVLQKSHVLLAGSLEAEGFGLPALEAMASGIPCVLTRVPCYLNLSSRADFAHFVTPRHPQEMADGVVRLMTDEGYRRKIVERGLEVVRHYSLDHLGDRLADFFTAIHEQGVAGNTLINRWSR